MRAYTVRLVLYNTKQPKLFDDGGAGLGFLHFFTTSTVRSYEGFTPTGGRSSYDPSVNIAQISRLGPQQVEHRT